jgi:hypothetical protein
VDQNNNELVLLDEREAIAVNGGACYDIPANGQQVPPECGGFKRSVSMLVVV